MGAHTVTTHARLQEIKDARGVSSVPMPSEFVLADEPTHAPSKGARVDTAWGPGVVVDVATYAGEALVRAVDASWGSVFDHTHGRWIPVSELSVPSEPSPVSVPARGVSLSKGDETLLPVFLPDSPYRQVNVIEGYRALGDDVRADAWWGVPRVVVAGWVTDALAKGDYAGASVWSSLLHRGPVGYRAMIIAQANGVGGSWESRVMPVKRAVARLRVEVGVSEAAFMACDALERPYEDHAGEAETGWDMFSARVVTALRVVCVAEHDGGFVETV